MQDFEKSQAKYLKEKSKREQYQQATSDLELQLQDQKNVADGAGRRVIELTEKLFAQKQEPIRRESLRADKIP